MKSPGQNFRRINPWTASASCRCLRGKRSGPRGRLYWHFPAYLQSYSVWDEQRDPLFRSRPCSIIRLGDWKLHQYFEDGGLELYNLREDIGETKNLAEANPAKTQELLKRLKAWQQEIGAPIPNQPNPAYDAQAEAQAIADMLNGKKPAKKNRNKARAKNKNRS